MNIDLLGFWLEWANLFFDWLKVFMEPKLFLNLRVLQLRVDRVEILHLKVISSEVYYLNVP